MVLKMGNRDDKVKILNEARKVYSQEQHRWQCDEKLLKINAAGVEYLT